MTCTVTYSTDFDRLVQKLTEAIGDPSTSAPGSWVEQWRQPAVVLVPSLDIGGYLKLAVARKEGVAVNFRFETLQSYLSEHIEAAAARDGERAFEILDREVLKTRLLDVLSSPEALDGELADVSDYLLTHADVADGTVDVRRYQLARQIATVFEEYIFSRPDLLARWEGERPDYAFRDNPTAGDIEEWQAVLWRRLQSSEVADASDPDYLSLPEAFDRVKSDMAETLRDELRGDTLHVFGFAGFGRQFLNMLVDLAELVDVHFYFHGPAEQAFVEGAKTQPWRELAADQLEGSDLHQALRNWAGPGAETIYQLGRAVDEVETLDGADIPDWIGGDDPPTLLDAVQTAIRRGGVAPSTEPEELAADGGEPRASDNADGGEPFPSRSALEPRLDEASPDETVKFLEAPGLRRELEMVANEIWQKVGSADNLAFSDIAVAVPESKAETYIAHLQSVFDEFHDLSYTVNSMSLAGNTPVMDAVDMLLELPFSTFTRSDLLALAIHPNVIGQFDDADEKTWVDWVDWLNILYGADRADQRRNGDHYLESDLFNWDQGMRRLALGTFLDVPENRAEATIEVGGDQYLPETVGLSEVDGASAFNVLASSLIDDARWLRDHRATLEEWADILSTMVETYLVPTADAGAEYDEDERVIGRVVTALEELLATDYRRERD
ncbi:MAG: exodeoxyribonuclease V subunit gamma, partial [Bradymonadaceae bacterium]